MDAHHDFVKLRVTVSRRTIERMWDRYESGMADRVTSNAIALAMRESIGSDHRVEVWRDDPGQRCLCRIGDGEELRLPRPVFDWLARAECGSAVKEISFALKVPGRYLCPTGGSENAPPGSD